VAEWTRAGYAGAGYSAIADLGHEVQKGIRAVPRSRYLQDRVVVAVLDGMAIMVEDQLVVTDFPLRAWCSPGWQTVCGAVLAIAFIISVASRCPTPRRALGAALASLLALSVIGLVVSLSMDYEPGWAGWFCIVAGALAVPYLVVFMGDCGASRPSKADGTPPVDPSDAALRRSLRWPARKAVAVAADVFVPIVLPMPSRPSRLLAPLHAYVRWVVLLWAWQLGLALIVSLGLCGTMLFAPYQDGNSPVLPIGRWVLLAAWHPLTGMAVGLVLTVLRFARPARVGQQAPSA
jgi:hypothetical protein